MSINKSDVEDFYNRFFNNKEIKAADKIIAENYIQHNKNILNGRSALKEAFRNKFAENEYFKLSIDKILIDENYIAVFLTNIEQNGQVKFSVVDLYRTENDKFVEHWDYFDYQNKN